MKLIKQLFGFPIDMRPGGWYHWRVRWVPLVVWTCLVNAFLFALVSIPREGGLVESSPVPLQTVQKKNP
jgi:hypothetical protein